jgi:hypothetical protein
MFLTLLIVTFFISLIVSAIVARVFTKPIDDILKRIISDPISSAWARYLQFAIYVVGISSGVRIWSLETYINPRPNITPLELSETAGCSKCIERSSRACKDWPGCCWYFL